MKKNYWGLLIAGIVAVVVLICGVLLVSRVLINKSFVRAYEKEDYSTEVEEKLLVMNSPEGYVTNYNLGNAAFKKGDYISAIAYYKEALKYNPPEDKECDIRINLALAMCYTIDFEDLDTREKKDEAIVILEAAKAILLEKGFATNNGDGSSADAQQLKDDIDKMIEQLMDDTSEGSDSNNSGQNETDESTSEEGNTSPDNESRIQKQLEKNRKEAMKEGNEMQSSMDKWSDYFNEDGDGSDYNYEDKKW